MRTARRHHRQLWEEKLGIAEGKLDEIVFECPMAALSTIGEVDEKAVWQNVRDLLILSENELSQLRQDFWADDFVDLELVTCLKKLRSETPCYILSNAWVGAREILHQKYQVTEGETVDKLFFSYELGLAKPDPAIFVKVAELVDIKLEEFLFIDDNRDNIRSAMDLGLQTVLFSEPSRVIQQLNSLLF